jgi:hypothetical protein
LGKGERLLAEQDRGDVEADENYTEDDSGIEQPLLKTAARLDHSAGAAKDIGQAAGFVLQGDDDDEHHHDYHIYDGEDLAEMGHKIFFERWRARTPEKFSAHLLYKVPLDMSKVSFKEKLKHKGTLLEESLCVLRKVYCVTMSVPTMPMARWLGMLQ